MNFQSAPNYQQIVEELVEDLDKDSSYLEKKITEAFEISTDERIINDLLELNQVV